MDDVRSFDDDWQMSHGYCETRAARDALLLAFPDATSIERASEREDRDGTDRWIVYRNGKRTSVDCKVRSEDFLQTRGSDDLVLETWSVLPTPGRAGVIGWTLDSTKRTDYIVWLWTPTGRWVKLPFSMLRAAFTMYRDDWLKRYRKLRHTTEWEGRRWQSESVIVPRALVWRAMEHVQGGGAAPTPIYDAQVQPPLIDNPRDWDE